MNAATRPYCRTCAGWGFVTRLGSPAPDAHYVDADHVERFRCTEPGCPGPVRHVEPGERIQTPEDAERERASEAMNAAEYASDTLEDR